MDFLTQYRALYANLEAGDVDAVRAMLTAHPELLSPHDGIGGVNQYFADAARLDNVPIMELLLEFGADVNAPVDEYGPEGPIRYASMNGAANAVRWLLEHRAVVNHVVAGRRRCLALATPAHEGRLDIVKLLVEQGGADFNAVWADNNALSFAIAYGKKDVEEYLRSKGAMEPWRLQGLDAPPIMATSDSLVKHVEEHLGPLEPLSLQEVVPGNPSIAVHVVRLQDRIALVTHGMSDQPLTVPPGSEEFQFTELIMYLPADWPLTESALQDERNAWPLEWIRRIARYPHDNKTWLGGQTAVIANGDPPQPYASNTRLSCMLLIVDPADVGVCILPDARHVLYYDLFPLYAEERDFEREHGSEALIERFAVFNLPENLQVDRPNVVTDTPSLL